MSEVSVLADDVVTLPVSEVATLINQPESRVHQLVRDGQLLSLRRAGEVVVPADFLDTTGERAEVVKGLPGTITVLRDGGFTDPEILRWLFTDAVLVFSLADFAFLVERRYGHTQKAFFDQILCLVTNHAKALKLEHRADRLGLHAPTVVTDRLLSAKLGLAAEGPLVVPNSLARKPWEALA